MDGVSGIRKRNNEIKYFLYCRSFWKREINMFEFFWHPISCFFLLDVSATFFSGLFRYLIQIMVSEIVTSKCNSGTGWCGQLPWGFTVSIYVEYFDLIQCGEVFPFIYPDMSSHSKLYQLAPGQALLCSFKRTFRGFPISLGYIFRICIGFH